MSPELSPVVLDAELSSDAGAIAAQIVEIAPYTLSVAFPDGTTPADGTEFSALGLRTRARNLSFGRCRFHSRRWR